MEDQYAAEIGRAWAHLRQGNATDALHEFEEILKSAPSHVDALYGLGLTRAAQGQKETAHSTFQKCLEIVDKERAKGHNDRWEMLQRMISQRVKETKSA